MLKNKYYFDELYDKIFVRPAYWLAETFTYLWVDRKVIDGFLHLIARITFSVGGFLRNFIDKPIINGFGDFVGESVKRFGRGAALHPDRACSAIHGYGAGHCLWYIVLLSFCPGAALGDCLL